MGQEVKNHNMVYQVPVWKQENIYLGAKKNEKHVLFGSKSKKHYLQWDTLHLHTKPSLLSTEVSRGYKIELSLFIQDLLHIYRFVPSGSRGDRWVGGIWGHGHTPRCSHMCTHTYKHAKIYMYRNCKWPATCLSWLTLVCVCVCVCVYMHVHACMCTFVGVAHTTHPPKTQSQ